MTIIDNAILVLPDRLLPGSLEIAGSIIAGIGQGLGGPDSLDLDGDYLIPGVIDLHTDNLERQVLPRSNARWPSRSAMVAHDAQCAAAGVTTVFDALCLGDIGFEKARVQTFRDGLADLDALVPTGLLKAEHFLHLRCELPAGDMLGMLDDALDHAGTRIVSLMDHSPGVGQYADIERYRGMRRNEGFAESEIEAMIGHLQCYQEQHSAANRRGLIERLARQRMAGQDLVLASHDDRMAEEVAANQADGIAISEFPVTMEAALAAKALGMQVIAGAPNIVRGGSHSGNVAVVDLIREGAVDALASDYVPASLIEAAFIIAGQNLLSLPEAVALITSNPARMVGLDDRGRIAPGLQADLVRVRVHEGLAIVRQVWRRGRLVA
jgi:alpha-D-ribose 1-methylphosphonate 5-triphosphate diphosphatase